MRKLLASLFLLAFSVVCAAQTQTNPATQIAWPLITGAGTPTSFNLACTSEVGMTVNITTSGGVVTAATINAGGSGIVVVPQTVQVLGGGGTGATLTITTASGGAATAITLVTGGSGYANTTGARVSVANYGQPYQNTAVTPNTTYTCGSDGWAQRGGSSGGITALTGDGTASGPGSATFTLSTVNSSVGTCGDATHVAQVTLDAKGRATACTAVAITGGSGISGATAGQALIAGSATTATSSMPLSFGGTNITTGIAITTSGDVPIYSNTTGAIADSTIQAANIATLNGTQTLTNKTLTSPTMTAPVLGTISSGVGTALTALNASNLGSGTVPTARLTLATNAAMGVMEGDGTSITCVAGVCSSLSGGSGTVTTTGSPASGNLTKFSGATSITNGDLSGDVTTSGTLVTTVVKVNGASLPTSTAVVGTNSSGQVIAVPAQAAHSVYGNFTGSSGVPGFSSAPVFSAALLTSVPACSTCIVGTTGSSYNGVIPVTQGGILTQLASNFQITTALTGSGFEEILTTNGNAIFTPDCLYVGSTGISCGPAGSAYAFATGGCSGCGAGFHARDTFAETTYGPGLNDMWVANDVGEEHSIYMGVTSSASGGTGLFAPDSAHIFTEFDNIDIHIAGKSVDFRGNAASAALSAFCIGCGGVQNVSLPLLGSTSSGLLVSAVTSGLVSNGNLSGDVTTSGALATTLATVSTTFGTCGDATHVCQVVTNAKGLVTSQSTVAITGGGAAFSALTTGVNNSMTATCGTGCSMLTSGSGSIIATNAISLSGGVLGEVPYQISTGNTNFTGQPTTSGHFFVLGSLPLGSGIAPIFVDLGLQTANTVLGSLTATTPSVLALPSCSGASNALTWTSGTGFGCNTISGGSITFPQTVGGTVNSGGIVYANSGTQISVSAAGTAGQVVLWGGAGTQPGAQAFGTSGATIPLLNTAVNFSGAGAASTSSFTFSGTLFTGGSGTTTFPNVYINQGTGPTTFSTSGTEFGINAPSGFSGNFLDFHINGGASLAKLDSGGNLTVASCTGCGGATSPLVLTSTAVGQIPLSLVGASGQTGNLLNITANGGSAGALANIDANGRLNFGAQTSSTFGINFSGSVNLYRDAGGGLRNDSGLTTPTIATNGLNNSTFNSNLTFAADAGGGIASVVFQNALVLTAASTTPSVLDTGTISFAGTSTGSWTGFSYTGGFGLATSNIYNGSAAMRVFSLTPTFNVGTSSTKGYEFIYGKPTETSVGTGLTNYFLHFQNAGGSDVFTADTAGRVTSVATVSGGTKFTTSGCSVSASTGGASAGVFTVGANTCSVVVTMNGATGITVPNGWSCFANDRTSTTVFAIQQTASSGTTATFSIPATAGSTDVISFGCIAF